MPYSAVYVIGDSLVDAGNALKLGEFVGSLPLIGEPDGLPTSDKGYYEGRFTNGFNFADLISNKFIGVTTKPVFPYGYSDPFLGISFGFLPDPDGNNLNFAYGGARIRNGDMPDMDAQTDAFRDAVDGHADPNALVVVTIGGNDVRALVPISGTVASLSTAQTRLVDAAQKFFGEMRDLIVDDNVLHIVVTGIPDVGIIPGYNGLVDEDFRRSTAAQYSALLDGMIYQDVLLLRQTYPNVTIDFVSFNDAAGSVISRLDQIFAPDVLASYAHPSDVLFFDKVHPTAQADALLAAYILDAMSGSPAGETLPLKTPDYHLDGTIGATGEVDSTLISLAANASYTFEALGISSGNGSLADTWVRIVGPTGTVLASNDDGGLGLDAVLTFTTAQAGDYTIQYGGVGSLTGSYRFQATGDAAGDNTYLVSHAGALILEAPGEGYDTVLASVSYALAPGVSIEKLATTSTTGKASINLTGNEFDQMIMGNAGTNVLDGKGGSDVLWGGLGKDYFAFTTPLDGSFDLVDDFSPRDDTIYLEDAIFAGLPLGTLAKAAFVSGAAAKDASDRIIYNPANGDVWFDPDGTGPLSAMHFATLDPGLKVTASDFFVI